MKFMNPIYSRYSNREVITEGLYKKKQEEMSAEDFAEAYEKAGDESASDSFYANKITYYRIQGESDPITLELLMAYDRLVAQEKSERHLKVIKACVIFFTVLAAIGIVAGIVMGSQVANAARYLF